MKLDPEEDRGELEAAVRGFEQSVLSLAELRRVAEAIVDRWRDPSNEKPPFTPAEVPLWNVVWEILLGCRESLGRGGIATLLSILDGSAPRQGGGPELRP